MLFAKTVFFSEWMDRIRKAGDRAQEMLFRAGPESVPEGEEIPCAAGLEIA